METPPAVEMVLAAARLITKDRVRNYRLPYVPAEAVVSACPADVWEYQAKDPKRLCAQLEDIYDRLEIGPIDEPRFRAAPEEERDAVVASWGKPLW